MRYISRFFLVPVLSASFAFAQTTLPTSAPSAPMNSAAAHPARQARRPAAGGPLGRYYKAIEQLDLTDEQTDKLHDLENQTRQQIQSLRDVPREQRRDKLRQTVQAFREKLEKILTRDQRQQLSENLRKDVEGKNRRRDEQAEKPVPEIHPAVQITPAGPQVGDAAPEFSLHRVNGRPVKLSQFKHRVLVLIFGSYTTPVFRDKAVALPELARRNQGKAVFLIIYTKEAHPAGGWTVERNTKENINIPQPTDEAGRLAVAQKAIDALHLQAIPVLLDTMDDATASAYAAFPDGVIVIGKDGKIAARQNWFDPTDLQQLINQAVEKK